MTDTASPARPEDHLSLAFVIRRSPEAVRDWWLEFPDEYRASDPDEQPFRIQTLQRAQGTIQVRTYWRGPLGMPLRLRETLGIGSPRAWTADLRMMGLHIHDEFHVAAAPEGAHLTIRSTVETTSTFGRLMRPLAARLLLNKMEHIWNDAARICERDAVEGRAPRTTD